MAKKDEAKTQDTKAAESNAVEAKADGKSGDVKAQEEKSGFNLTEFFQGTKEELDKVVWPSRQQLVSESVAVILMVILSATTIYLVDNLFSWAARQVF